MSSKNTLSFVVTVAFNKFLEPNVVRNYVQMAMKKYNKLCLESNKADYFSGAGHVDFKITEVAAINPENLREVVDQINKLAGHFELVE